MPAEPTPITPGINPRATLLCADALDAMRAIPTASIQLVVTSPPYNIKKKYERAATPMDQYLQYQKEIIAQAARITTHQGSIVWQVGNHVADGEIFPLDLLLYDTFKANGLQLRNRIIWHYEHGLHASRRFSGRYETLLWFSKTKDYTFHLDRVRVPSKYPNKKHFKGPKKGLLSGNPLGKNPGDVWLIPNVKHNHPEKTTHPCQFPIELIERLVLALTDPGDTLLDPFAGAGSAILAAIKHQRAAIGIDLVPEYIDLMQQRIDLLTQGRLPMRPMGKPIFTPPTIRA